jgi:hypothetical protein
VALGEYSDKWLLMLVVNISRALSFLETLWKFLTPSSHPPMERMRGREVRSLRALSSDKSFFSPENIILFNLIIDLIESLYQ